MPWRCWGSLLMVIGISGYAPLFADAFTPEYKLQADLFANYNPQVRPSWPNEPIEVYLDLLPIAIRTVNIREQTVTFNGLLTMSWHDTFLQWTPSNYSGVSVFNIDPKYIWTPPIGLYNSVDKFYDADAGAGLYARVESHGDVSRQMFGEFTFTCAMDPTNFPYDSHICGLQFGSPSMSEQEMFMIPSRSPLDMWLYRNSGQWAIVNTSAIKEQVTSTDNDLVYGNVTFSFLLARLNMFHMLNIVAPLILTILLVPCLFLLPADAGEKLGLGITLLLALSVFLLTLSENTPETADYVPLLTIFVTIQLIVTTLSIICTTLILRIHHNNSPKRPPKWARTCVLGWLARCLCLGDQRKETKEALNEASWTTKSPNVRNSLQNLKEKAKGDDEFLRLSPGNRKLLEYLELMALKVKDEEEASEVSDEWKRIAYVLDWICFWIFTITILVATITIFVKGNADGAARLGE